MAFESVEANHLLAATRAHGYPYDNLLRVRCRPSRARVNSNPQAVIRTVLRARMMRDVSHEERRG